MVPELSIIDSARSFQSNNTKTTSRRKETAQEVAIGTGVTGAAYHNAQRMPVNKVLKNMYSRVTAITKTTRNNAQEVTGLFGKFKSNIVKFTSSLRGYADKFKNVKYIGAVVKSPITQGIIYGSGVAMAFFALVTGLYKAYKNGRISVEDIKSRFDKAA